MERRDFTGKTVLVTGGARGIGRAVARRLAGEGARVGIGYLSRTEDAARTLAELQALGGAAVLCRGDVATPEGARAAAGALREALGPIDMLVHCAGILIAEPLSQVSWETWRRTMSVNLDGTFNSLWAVKDEMIQRGFGRIVVLSSIAALRPRPQLVHYAASKAAIISLVQSCSEAWAGHNVRINTVCPGFIETEMTSASLSPEALQQLVQATPMRRPGQPGEIAAVVRFLLSEESSFMTGQAVAACGGRVLLP